MKTRDPNFVPEELATNPYAPWEAPVYSASDMLSLFSSANYGNLNSVYVATNGNDETGTGSISEPYKSISKAIDIHNEAGTIIRVQAGEYFEKISIDVEATKDAPFVVYSEDGPGAAIINGNDIDQDIIVLSGTHNVIDGFEVHNTKNYAIGLFSGEIEYSDKFNVVRNCKVHDAGRDIIKSSHVNFILIENCNIYDCRNLLQNDNAIDGVGVYHTICRNNYIHDISPGFGGYFKGGSHNNIWYNNVFKDIGDESGNGFGAGLQLGGTGEGSWRDDKFYEYPAGHEQLAFNNLFINCTQGSIVFCGAWKSKVYNNSFLNCGYIESGTNSVSNKSLIKTKQSANLPSQDLEIYNNISFHDPSYESQYFFSDGDLKYTTGQISHGYNTVSNNSVSFDFNFPDGLVSNDVVSYFAYANDSLEILSGIDVIDAGINSPFVPFDFYYNARPINITDRGAHEQ